MGSDTLKPPCGLNAQHLLVSAIRLLLSVAEVLHNERLLSVIEPSEPKTLGGL